MSLVVKIEIHPGGDASRAREVSRVVISNRSELADVSDYVVEARDVDGQAESFCLRAHQREKGFWPLVKRAIAGVTR